MMMVSGISFPEYLPAVAVPTAIMPHIDKAQSVATNLQPVQPYSATTFRQHRNQFDRSLQDSYDMHGRMVRNQQPTGTQLNTLI